MSLRGNPVEERAELPDGRGATIWIGVPDDDYVARRDLETVAIELRVDGSVAAALLTTFDPDDESEARFLARELAEGLASGRLEPTAGALEPIVV